MNAPIQPRSRVVLLGLLAGPLVLLAQTRGPAPELPVRAEMSGELSPFLVQESSAGYYAAQTLAGSRLRQDLKDLGASIQVVTKDLLDDLGATGIEELFQYTTSTEVGGIGGNFTGATDGGTGDVSTDSARRGGADGATRVRGLAAPSRSRNYFPSGIPFDSYNADRVDISRGANSFLFGLGSPAGLTNTSLVKARFRDTNELATRIGSGGRNPSYRGSFNLNRVLIRDTLALYGAVLMDRTQYRQRPTYKDDDRRYAAVTYQPFKHAGTVLTAHVENGRIRGNAPDVLLPAQNLDQFLDDPVVGRMSVAAWDNLQRFAHVEGPTQAQWSALPAAERARYRVRDTPTPNSLAALPWGAGSYGLVYDGTNGRLPAFAYTDQYRAADYAARDPFFGPGRTTKGAPVSPYHGNRAEIMGTGWLDQGFTNLKTFDFSREHLGWDSDYNSRDFVNYNVALEQVLWGGRAGFELAYNYEDLFQRSFNAINANARVIFDMQETLWLPTDPNYRTSGIVAPQPNPNYARPFVLARGNPATIDAQRAAARFTGFVKYDFAERLRRHSWLGRLLGRHTLTALADQSTDEARAIAFNLSSFADPDPALHIGNANARITGNASRNVPLMVYVGPPQPQAFTDPNFQLRDFVLTPAKYQLRPPADYSIRKLTWNLGPDSNNENLGLDSRANGNEGFVWANFTPRDVPNNNCQAQETRVSSFALNGQSIFWDHLLVVNTGYRVDTVRNWLNVEPPLVGLDQIPNVSPAAFRAADGVLTRIKNSVFGYGAVLNWPQQLLRLPARANATLHFNQSENFVPAPSRVDELRRPVDSPGGLSKDYGFSVYLWDQKVVARFNWYRSRLLRASSSVSTLFHQTNANMFNHFGFINADLRRLDGNNDGRIDDAALAQIAVDPATGLTPAGLTRDQAARQMWPNLARAREAMAAIAPYLTDELKAAVNYRMLPDGTSQVNNPGVITDTNDLEARGFEAEITLNPTAHWRMSFNAASQETILTNVAPRLTRVLDQVWLPHLAQYGDLDWNEPVGVVSGNTLAQQVNDRLLEYFAIKGQEGRPQMEQRRWRFNLVTRYGLSEGRLRGFSVGGAVRWEDSYAAGYPIFVDDRGVIQPDLRNPWFAPPQTSYDCFVGYRRRISGNRDWTAQLNVRNLQNAFSDKVTAIRYQPDGTVARVRFDPPLQMYLTNTIRF